MSADKPDETRTNDTGFAAIWSSDGVTRTLTSTGSGPHLDLPFLFSAGHRFGPVRHRPAAREGWHGPGLRGGGGRERTPRRRQAPEPRPRRRRGARAVPAGGAARGVAQPSQLRLRLRHQRGPGLPGNCDGARAGRHAQGSRGSRRADERGAGRGRRAAGDRRARGRGRARSPAPRREAVELLRASGRPRARGRLRTVGRERERRRQRAIGPRHARVCFAGAAARRAARSPIGHLRGRRDALLSAGRPRAIRRPEHDRVGPQGGGSAAAVAAGDPAGPPGADGRHCREMPGQESVGSLSELCRAGGGSQTVRLRTGRARAGGAPFRRRLDRPHDHQLAGGAARLRGRARAVQPLASGRLRAGGPHCRGAHLRLLRPARGRPGHVTGQSAVRSARGGPGRRRARDRSWVHSRACLCRADRGHYAGGDLAGAA